MMYVDLSSNNFICVSRQTDYVLNVVTYFDGKFIIIPPFFLVQKIQSKEAIHIYILTY